MAMSKRVANAPQVEFPEWRAKHRDCNIVRLESGESGIGLVSYVCRNHREMLVAEIVRPITPGTDPLAVE